MDLGPMADDNDSSRVGSEPRLTSPHTEHDVNDMFCEYPSGFPSYDPESSTLLECLCDDPTLTSAGTDDEATFVPPIIPNYFCYVFFSLTPQNPSSLPSDNHESPTTSLSPGSLSLSLRPHPPPFIPFSSNTPKH